MREERCPRRGRARSWLAPLDAAVVALPRLDAVLPADDGYSRRPVRERRPLALRPRRLRRGVPAAVGALRAPHPARRNSAWATPASAVATQRPRKTSPVRA